MFHKVKGHATHSEWCLKKTPPYWPQVLEARERGRYHKNIFFATPDLLETNILFQKYHIAGKETDEKWWLSFNHYSQLITL